MPSRSAGMASVATISIVRVRRELRRGQHIHRQHEFDAALVGLGHELAHPVELVFLQQRAADLVALRLEERVGHAAADQQPVDLGQQVRDDAELVGHLRAAEHHHVGPGRVVGEPAQHARSRPAPAGPRSAAAARPRRRRRPACGAPHRNRRTRTRRPSRPARPGRRPARPARPRPCWSRAGRTARSPAAPPGRRPARPPRTSPSRRPRRRPARPRRRAVRPAARRPARSEYLASGSPLGRPRCAVTTTRAPAAVSASMVGTDARTRPSSVMRSPSSGTLRSARSSTRRPVTPSASRSSSVFICVGSRRSGAAWCRRALVRSARRLE